MADTSATAKAKSSGIVTSRVPGTYPRRKLQAGVVPYGHATQEVCETIFRTMITDYGLSGTNEGVRDQLLWCLAEAFVHGTSTEINWGDVWFTLEGSQYSMAALAGIAGRFIGHTNPIRVWVRDFRKGELPMRMHELLNSAENMELRQTMAANYGTTVDNARFCFDTAGALINSGMSLSHSDMALIGNLSAYTISRAQQDAHSRGEPQASSNHAGIVGGVRPSVAGPPGPSVPAPERAGFKALR